MKENLIELAAQALDSYNSGDYFWGLHWASVMRENGEFIFEEDGIYFFRVSYREDVYDIDFRMTDGKLIPIRILEVLDED